MTRDDELEDLRRRLRRVESRDEILATLYQYGHSLDYGDLDGFLDCFLPDAFYGSLRDDRQDVGHAAITDFFGRHSHAPDAWHKHLLVEPRISFDGDVARVVSYYAVLQVGDGGPFVSHFGHYDDELVPCPDGRWRFRRRFITNEAIAPGDVSPLRPKTAG